VEVEIEGQIYDLYLAPYKITREQVIDTINNSDITKTIRQGGYTLALSLKRYDRYYILVDGRPKDSSILVSSAYKFHEDLIRDLPPDNPLGILEQFAKKVGFELRIGDERSKFIHATEIRLPKANPTDDFGRIMEENVSIFFDENHNDPTKPVSVGDMLMRPRDMGGLLYVDVALAYCISTSKYI
jgi:hypothetical protein